SVRARRRDVGPRALARPLPPRPPGARGRHPAGPALRARFPSLRPVARPVFRVSRNRAPSASAPVLPAPARRREVPLRRPRPRGVAPSALLGRRRPLARPADAGDYAPALRGAALRGFRVLAPSPRALLSLRGVDAHALVRGRDH